MNKLSDNSRGALLMIATMAAFTANDTFFKSLSDDMPLAQGIFLRGCLVTAALVAYFRISGAKWSLGTGKNTRLVLIRTLAEMVTAYLFLTALFNMPLANATAILQALPLTVSLAGAYFFAESLGWRRLAAIAIGFVGVLLIIRPGTDGFSVYSLFVVAAVLTITLRDLVTRGFSSDVSSVAVATVAAVGITAAFGVVSIWVDWQPITLSAAISLAGAAACIILAYVLSVAVMRVGEVGFVSPFRYSSLIFALVLGFFVFDEWPDTLALFGAAIVVATGIYTLWRERYWRLKQDGSNKTA